MFWDCYLFFFCKQKTAYEMRISDWSSDVCSSDLIGRLGLREGDRIVVQRAGDVMPQVVDNLTRDNPGEIWAFDCKCPDCGSEAVREEGEVDYRCTGGLICQDRKSTRLNSST